MRTITWQIFGTAEVEDDFDVDELSDEMYSAMNWLDGFSVSGLDWEDA